MKSLIHRAIQLRWMGMLGLLLFSLILLGGMIERNVRHLERVHAYMNYSHRIQQASLNLQQVLLENISGKSATINPSVLKQLHREVKNLIFLDYYSAVETPKRLRQLDNLFSDLIDEQNEKLPFFMLFPALTLINQVLDTEIIQDEQILENIIQNTRTELELAVGTLIALFLLGGWFFVTGFLTH